MLEVLEKKFHSMCSSYPYYSKRLTSKETLEGYVDWMIKNHNGFVLYAHNEPVSFMHNIMSNQMFYKEKGVYTAEWGYYFDESYLSGMPLLLKASYEIYLEGKYTHHAISLLNHEPDTIKAFFENGYGSRCVDSLLKLANEFDIDYNGFSVAEATADDLESIIPIIEEHDMYMCAAPTLLGFDYTEPKEQYKEWMDNDDIIIWKATKDNLIYGIMMTTKGKAGGCDSIYDDKTIGIQTTHVLEKYRGNGIGKLLVEHVANYGVQQGYEKLSVDYESLNPSANAFWKKYFTPVITSVTRYLGK